MTGQTQPKPWTTTIDGQKLRELRQQRGMSQATLASKSRTSITNIARLERQPRSPCRTWTAARLAAALDCQTTDLIAPA